MGSAEYKAEWQRRTKGKRKAEFFEGKTCVKCGSSENLELDHIDPSTKICTRIWGWRESRRLEELGKCQVLCRPCHVEKTRLEGGFNKNKAYGVNNGSSKLTEVEVLKIRSLITQGESQRFVAKKFNVGKTTVAKIINRVTWRHL